VTSRQLRRSLKWTERAFFLAGLLCLLYVGSIWTNASVEQRAAKRELAAMTESAHGSDAVKVPEAVAQNSLIGALDIPRIGLSVAVREGDQGLALETAVGHLPDTPLPWQNGNAAFAGHRDTFFRPLRNLRFGDEIQLRTIQGTFEYEVRHMTIVEPDALWILDAPDDVALTLITCYPFTYIGPAPQRFIVQAERIGGNAGVQPVSSRWPLRMK